MADKRTSSGSTRTQRCSEHQPAQQQQQEHLELDLIQPEHVNVERKVWQRKLMHHSANLVWNAVSEA
jgi:hypothetical protein